MLFIGLCILNGFIERAGECCATQILSCWTRLDTFNFNTIKYFSVQQIFFCCYRPILGLQLEPLLPQMLLEDLPLPGGLAAVVLVGQHHVDPPHAIAEVVSLVRGFGLQHNSRLTITNHI